MDLVGCQESDKRFNPILFSYNFCNEACNNEKNACTICIPLIGSFAFLFDIITCPCRCFSYYNYHFHNTPMNNNQITPIIEEQPEANMD